MGADTNILVFYLKTCYSKQRAVNRLQNRNHTSAKEYEMTEVESEPRTEKMIQEYLTLKQLGVFLSEKGFKCPGVPDDVYDVMQRTIDLWDDKVPLHETYITLGRKWEGILYTLTAKESGEGLWTIELVLEHQ